MDDLAKFKNFVGTLKANYTIVLYSTLCTNIYKKTFKHQDQQMILVFVNNGLL